MSKFEDPELGLLPELGTTLEAARLRFVAKNPGKDVEPTSGRRSFGKQARIWATYRKDPALARELYGVVSAPAAMGVSRHHGFYSGLAAACDAGVVGARDAREKEVLQRKFAAECQAAGLRWGGDWGDLVHFELRQVEGRAVDPFAELPRLGDLLDAAVK